MARNTQLLQLLDDLRKELKESTNPAHGVNTVGSYKYKLNATYEFLFHDYAWSFLKEPQDVETQAGERYYNLPVAANSIKKVEYKWGNVWRPLPTGVAGREMNSQDSDNDQRADPAIKWQLRGAAQFEIWPVPATDGNPVRFYGNPVFSRLVNNNDRCLLDDRLVVLFTATGLVPKDRYQRTLAEANSVYASQKKQWRSRSRGFVLGGGGSASRPPPGPVRVGEGNRSGN